jgi:hypothetical protein
MSGGMDSACPTIADGRRPRGLGSLERPIARMRAAAALVGEVRDTRAGRVRHATGSEGG